jgi:NADPH:quinone reductase-like Zn-dependent oxidoreductase
VVDGEVEQVFLGRHVPVERRRAHLEAQGADDGPTGRDVAGTVEEIGEGVTDVAVGDRVFGVSDDGAGAAELALLTYRAAIPAPLGFVDAAALPSALETATRSLDQLGVSAGTTLFVNGATGGIGSTAVQLAVARGARVIGAAGAANQDYLSLSGAQPVTYGHGMPRSGSSPRPRWRRRRPSPTSKAPKERGVHFGNGFADGPAYQALAEVGELIAAGRFWLPVERTFPLAGIARAHRAGERGHVRGRLVLVVG